MTSLLGYYYLIYFIRFVQDHTHESDYRNCILFMTAPPHLNNVQNSVKSIYMYLSNSCPTDFQKDQDLTGGQDPDWE